MPKLNNISLEVQRFMMNIHMSVLL